MRKIFTMLLAGMFMLAACGPKGEGLQADGYWIRSGMKGKNGAAYMTIHNYTGADVALVGVSSDVAAAVEVHLSSMGADGAMKMEKQDSVSIPAGGELELKPGSYHIMFIGLTKDLNVGDEIALRLHFDGYEDIALTVPVQDAADRGGSGMDGQHMP